MKKVFISLLLGGMMTMNAMAQTLISGNEATKVENQIKTATSSVNSIKSDFKQIKHVNGMTKDLESKGLFYYKKSNKVRFDYTSPMKYNMTVNGTTIKMGEKAMTAKSGMTEMLTMMEACLTGNMDPLKTKYNLAYYQTSSSYIIKISPKVKNNYIEEIDITMNKSNKVVTNVKMVEPIKKGKKGNDYTEYLFSNTQQNTNLADSLFK